MENFEKRRDRFNFFESFENPLLNVATSVELPNYVDFCKKHHRPPFHFFLFHLLKALHKTENFRYRQYEGKIIKIDSIIPSFTVMNQDGMLNYTRFGATEDLDEFIRRSLKSKEIAEASGPLINTGVELTERELKNYVFLTCLPWLEFTSIQHPIYRFKSADIPAIAWGKHTVHGDRLKLPISVMAHHGFVDGFHIHSLLENLKVELSTTMSCPA